MSWIGGHRHSALVVGLTIAVPFLLFAYACLELWLPGLEYRREIARLEPRIARLSGLLASQEELLATSGTLDARVHSLVYPASTPQASAAANLQTEARQLAADAGLDVSNSQVLPARELATLQQLAVTLRLGGELAALDAFLEDLAGYRPLILVESIAIQPARTRGAGESQQLTVSVQLMSLRQAG